jgi:hypothetical protein
VVRSWEYINFSQIHQRFGGMLPLFLFVFTLTEHTYNILYIILVVATLDLLIASAQ